jgi:hypothetical protein
MAVSNLSARVAQPNTPETDAMPVVDHTVEYMLDGIRHSLTIPASDPMSAINIVRRMYEEKR